MLCTSVSMDDVMFAHNRQAKATLTRHILKVTHQVAERTTTNNWSMLYAQADSAGGMTGVKS